LRSLVLMPMLMSGFFVFLVLKADLLMRG